MTISYIIQHMPAERPKIKIWVGDTPPDDLHSEYVDAKGRHVPSWLVPIVVVDSSDTPPNGVRVLKQGDGGTTENERAQRFDLKALGVGATSLSGQVDIAVAGEPIAVRLLDPAVGVARQGDGGTTPNPRRARGS